MLEYRFLLFNWAWTKLFWFCPEHNTLQYCEREGWELLGAQGEFLQWWWNVIFAWGDSPSLCEGKQMDCRDVLHPAPRDARAELRRLIEGKGRSVPFCPLLNPSLCCQKWLWNGSAVNFLCRNGLVTFISLPLCILARSFCVPVYPKSLLGVLD